MKTTLRFYLVVTWFFPAFLSAQTCDTAWIASVQKRVMAVVNAGDLRKGYDLCVEALDTARIRYGEASCEATEMLVGISDYQKFTGDFQAAEQTVTTCLNNWRGLLGERHVKVAEALHSLGFVRFRLRQFDTVEPLYAEARQMFIDLGMSPSIPLAFLASDLAGYYESRGLFLKAEQSHLEALRLAKTLPQMPPELYSVLLNNTAVFYNAVQRQEQALPYMDDHLGVLEKMYGDSHPFYLRSLVNKGVMLMDAGRYFESRNLLEHALAAARRNLAPGDASLSFYLRKLAMLYQRLGQYEAAIRLDEESLALLKTRYGDAYPAYSDNLTELALALQNDNRLSGADTLLRETIRILERDGRSGEIGYAYALTNLGSLYQTQRRYGEAGPLLEKGAQAGGKLLGAETPAFYLRFGAALIRQYLLENRPDTALRLLDALRTPILDACGEEHRLYVALEIQYGTAWRLKGDVANAMRHFKNAFVTMRRQLTGNFPYLSAEERERYARTFEGFRTAVLTTAGTFPQDEGVRTFLYDLTLFQKTLLISFDRRQLAAWQQNPDSTYRAYVEVRRMIARQWVLPVKERLDLPELEVRRAALEKALAGKPADAIPGNEIEQSSWEDVRLNLREGEAALEWLILPAAREDRETSRYAALIVRREQNAPELVLLPEVATVDVLFASKGSRGLQYATRTYGSDALYRALWQPLEDRLKGIRRICYAPAGALHLLNFDAIPAPDGQLLSEKYQLVRVTNTARLTTPRREKLMFENGSALLAGGLDYESTAGPETPGSRNFVSRGAMWRGSSKPVREWSTLPNTLPEVEGLDALLRKQNVQTTLLTGADGTESAVKTRCNTASPTVLHFATHGFFFEKNTPATGSLGLVAAENPMFRSGLILSGANPAWRGDPIADSADDGILTADEISLLPLRNTVLVVLSACETGLGDVSDDEGVYGLQRAFRLAGAQNIVMSLWRVPDAQTRQFMESFYAALLENGDVRQALQQARQAIRREFANPYYWAGFVLLE